MSFLNQSAIKSVTFYKDGIGTSCDRCGTGIKNIFAVTYQDGLTEKYGSECINKIMDNAPDLLKLFQTNSKKLIKLQEHLRILTGPVEEMPRGSEYFNSGLYFIADSKGKDISFGHWFFHPIFDVEKNNSRRDYNQASHGITPAMFAEKQLKEFETRDKAKMIAEIARLEAFLAKILRAAAKRSISIPEV